MSYKSAVLRIADAVASVTLFGRMRPTYYCGRWMWVPATMWQSLYSRYELAVARALRDNFREGQTFWDVGAHIGWFSLFAAKIAGPSGQVVAFEPAPEAFAALSVCVKDIDCITPLAVAVGNADTKRAFHAHGLSTVSSFVEEITQAGLSFHQTEPIKTVEVALHKLDSLAMQLPVPALIKIDVEGFELEALHGATALLARTRPILIIEVHPRHLVLSGGSERGMFEFLGGSGYSWEVLARYPSANYAIICKPTSPKPHLDGAEQVAEKSSRSRGLIVCSVSHFVPPRANRGMQNLYGRHHASVQESTPQETVSNCTFGISLTCLSISSRTFRQ